MQPTYRVVATGEIGHLIPCPCDNPVILEFKDGIRDAFHLRELEPTTHPVTASADVNLLEKRKRFKGRPVGMEYRTVEKMLKIHAFLTKQTEPVYRKAIQDAVGFDITRALMNQPSQPAHTVTMEGLGLVERMKGERTWVAWQLTELGWEASEEIIRGLI